MTPEQDYVRRATRGLRGQARQETQAELLDHLTARACQLVLGGLSHEQARAQAMQELGAPTTVARSLRREQGFTTAGQLALGTLTLLTLLTSLTARLYAQGNHVVSNIVDRVLFPEGSGWVDPCQHRSSCVSIYSDALTPDEIRQAGLVKLNSANTYLTGSGVRLHGLLRKSLTLTGYPDQPVEPVEVGRDGHPGTQRGYLHLPRALNSAAQHGWPLQLVGNGLKMTVKVAGQPLGVTDQLGMHVVATYLQQVLDQHLKTDVLDAVPVRPSSFVQVDGWALPFIRTGVSTPVLSLNVPDPQRLYAAVSFVPEYTNQSWTALPALRALHVPIKSGRLSVAMSDLRDRGPTPLRLVSSREHFLAQVRAGHAVAMLVEVPRNLRPTAELGIVNIPERTLTLRAGEPRTGH